MFPTQNLDSPEQLDKTPHLDRFLADSNCLPSLHTEDWDRVVYRGRKAIEVCSEKSQTQPELASGINTNPPAGIILIQQPGLVGESFCGIAPPSR